VDRQNPHKSVEDILRPQISRQEAVEAVRNLLTGRWDPSAEPRSAATEGGPGRRNAAEGRSYHEAFQKAAESLSAVQARLCQERQAAPGQWAVLESHPQARRQVMIRNDKRLQSWGLYDLLLERSRGLVEGGLAAPANAMLAAELADLALTVATNLDPAVHGEERVADFRAAALAALGNARRLALDLVGSRVAFQQARLSLEMGTGDPIEEANLSTLLTHLLCDLGEYEKAARTLDRASALYRRFGDTLPEPPAALQKPENEIESHKARKGA
jgi:hypothetical protein